MGFLLRSSRDFQSPKAMTLLFKTLVRPILEYSSVVWNPYQVGNLAALKPIQIKLYEIKLNYDLVTNISRYLSIL